ncbi:UDP-N-acetylmuramoyl-tripeptide--D-alanyl-D-alanine ligase [Aeromicrobium ginsengisoli]|uniref:UDP-N-acetylmuramoyl-tripeptide--D-alanyl-D-alanine ligase n=1 Tax=Aeromicrobium ginsengisoli TaxID=363867 RepID=A0A5M4FI03_9ACTN|nr:UDP-N-acetylmuramoyl-tripeptide--D-alanyl-D-alanine ligase [Aeromicrobium ginsengisoli]KAA1399740.1 UDP-N-acetylmuramoyl-tripeptide--D-alanyl-D-alanine ligase [Aeromicrobium ginsengisoli]
MIPLTLRQIAEITGGTVHGNAAIVVDAPATLDSRAAEPGGLFVAIVGEHADGHEFAAQAVASGAAAVLGSREVDAPAVIVDDVVTALGRLARHVIDELEDVTVVAITGSSGKTSAKDLIAQLLEPDGSTIATAGNFNNELGVPLTVLRADELTRFLVVEMGARALGNIADLCRIVPPDVGVVLNVGHAHIGEFGSAEVIAQTKGELAEAVEGDGVVVLNADDPLVSAMAARTDAAIVTFGQAGDVRVSDLEIDEQGSPRFILTNAGRSVPAYVPLIGEYHAWNAAAAVATAIVLGVDLTTAAERLARVGPRSAMRMERHVRPDGVVVVNDAYNANPESMAAALRAIAAVGGDRAIAVLGEMLELGGESHEAHVEVGRLAAELGYSRVIVVGDGARGIAEGAGEIAVSVDDVDVAVRTLSASLSGHEVVLVKASRGGRLERVADALLQG